MADGRVIAGLGDLAAVEGMPSEATLRKLIRENPDFPVLSHGTNGVSYEIDVAAAVAWIKARAEAELAAKRARSEEVRQFTLELLGNDAASAGAAEGLSASERKLALEEELLSIKLAERRGELLRKSSIEGALSSIIIKDAQRRASFAQRLAKRIELTREQIAAIDALADFDRRAFADELEHLCDADAAVGADPAV